MAMIKCPECNQEISDQASVCPHCGYPIQEKAMAAMAADISSGTAQTSETQTSTVVETVPADSVEAYDVMLADYVNSKSSTISDLMNFLAISRSDAEQIVETVPCYIYDDIEKADAERIARQLQNCGMRIAVYDPVGNVRYFEPARYASQPLPLIVPVPRRRRWINPHPPVFHYSPFSAPAPGRGPNRGGGMPGGSGMGRRGGGQGGPGGGRGGMGGGHGGSGGGGRGGRGRP